MYYNVRTNYYIISSTGAGSRYRQIPFVRLAALLHLRSLFLWAVWGSEGALQASPRVKVAFANAVSRRESFSFDVRSSSMLAYSSARLGTHQNSYIFHLTACLSMLRMSYGHVMRHISRLQVIGSILQRGHVKITNQISKLSGSSSFAERGKYNVQELSLWGGHTSTSSPAWVGKAPGKRSILSDPTAMTVIPIQATGSRALTLNAAPW